MEDLYRGVKVAAQVLIWELATFQKLSQKMRERKGRVVRGV